MTVLHECPEHGVVETRSLSMVDERCVECGAQCDPV